jgi:hypothetical protein
VAKVQKLFTDCCYGSDQQHTAPECIDWYERRHELESGMVFRDLQGDLVQLDRSVPGDATQWYVADWWNGSWAWMDSIIEPGDLRGEPQPDPAEQVSA